MHRNAVAVVVSGLELATKVMHVGYINDRITKLKIRVDGNILIIVEVYAPQFGLYREEKEDFPVKLENTMRSSRTVIMGHFILLI